MVVIAVDPAPSKPSTVFDGKFHSLPAKELIEFLQFDQSHETILICWDAPLTGPADPDAPGNAAGDFSRRAIEEFFSRGVTGYKTPPGISVRHYSGCPHWAISRAVVGLPRCGPWGAANSHLPFSLITSDSPPERCGKFIVEVHPAVAAWLWSKSNRLSDAAWDYKKKPVVLDEMWEVIRPNMAGVARDKVPQNDDEFDVLVAYSLGVRWLEESGTVFLLGDRSTGSFLLPASVELSRAFARFLAERKTNQHDNRASEQC
jgi:hypothetical protein